LAERLVQEVRRRVVLADAAAAGVIDFQRDRSTGPQRTLLDLAVVHEQIACLLLGVGDAEPQAVGGDDAGVADLAAGLAVERRLVDDPRAALAGLEFDTLLAIAHERGNDALGLLGLVAQELGRAELFAETKPYRLGRGFAGAGPGGARGRALALHRRVE